MTQKYDSEFAHRHIKLNHSLGIPEEHTVMALAQSYGKEEEMRAALAQLKTGNGYRKDGRSLVDILDEVCTKKTSLAPYGWNPRVYSVDDDFLAVEHINCVDADGNVFEQYDRLLVDKDVVRGDDCKHVKFTPYRAIVHFEKTGSSFLPSLALSCNIGAALYQHKDDPEVKPVLMHYNHGFGFGWPVQNTVIDWGEEKIIHYPHKNDFTEHGGKTSINQARQRTLLPFLRTKERKFWFNKSLSDTILEKGLKDPLMARFVCQLTGLQDPSVLVELGNCFGKTAMVFVSPNNVTRVAWFGCYRNNLSLDGGGYLGGDYAARGVRVEV